MGNRGTDPGCKDTETHRLVCRADGAELDAVDQAVAGGNVGHDDKFVTDFQALRFPEG